MRIRTTRQAGTSAGVGARAGSYAGLAAAFVAGLVTTAGTASGSPAPDSSAAAAPARVESSPAAAIPLTVTATPSNIIIPLTSRALVSGVVKGATSARPVRIELSYGRQWLPVGNGTTDKTGAYTLRIPSAKLGTFTYRVHAPAAGPAASGASKAASDMPSASVPFSVSVGQGNPKAYKLFIPAGRWNPCQIIGYRVNLSGAPEKALDDVKIAIANVARVTGLKYAYRGTSTVIPGATKEFLSPYPKDTQLVIAWVKPGTTKHLSATSNYVGYGGWLSVGRPTRFGSNSYYPVTQGFVVVDRTRRMPSGFNLGDPNGLQGTWGQLVMHELGHTVGLTHVSDKTQLMYPYLQYRAAAWGLGDLGGLYNLGTRMPCFPASALPKAGAAELYAGLLAPLPAPARLALVSQVVTAATDVTEPVQQVWAGDH